MRKKWLPLVWATVLAVSVTACKGSEKQAEESITATEQTEAAMEEESGDLKPGDEISGFTLKEVGSYDAIGGETFYFQHEKSGAELFYVKNDDPNLGFAITYRTPHVDETDTNHVFEHAVIASSEKYPSKNIFFDMAGKTYNTFINAFTYIPFTSYPVSSQSQEQLEKMADVYLSCMVAPGLLEDERFFQREAVRYELRDINDPITIKGTVYSEDFGMITETGNEAFRNVLQALYPGEIAANVNGRAHMNYQGLTYEHTVETYDRCYSFDNSLILLYGDMDYEKFLEFLDKEYLAEAEKGNKDLSQYKDGKTEPGYVEETVYSPAYEGDSTENASIIYYAADLSEDSWEQLYQYQIIGQILSSDSSILNENLREAGISDPAFAEMVFDVEKPMFVFGLVNTDEDKAQTFKEVVDKTITEISQSGIDKELVDTILKTKEIDDYTAMENTEVFTDQVLPMVSTKWAVEGTTDFLEDSQNAFQNMKEDKDQALIKEFGERFLNAERKAMITTVPKPGLAEEIEKEQADYLADMKASMTEEELQQMIEDTLAFDQWNASEMANSDFTIDVKELPDPEPFAEFEVKDLNGITSYTSASDLDKISSNQIYLDTSSVKQDDLHYITLYTLLASELGTEKYEKAEKDNLLYQYLYSLSFSPIYPGEDAKDNHHPMLSIGWYSLADDYKQSLELLVEILENTDLTDEAEIKRVLDKYLPALDQSRGDGFALAQDLAISGSDLERRYTNYLEGQEFYKFVKNVRESLEADPSYIEELREKITSVKDLILRKDNLIVMNTASQDNLDKMEKVSEEILGALPSLENGAETYDFPEPEKNQAVIVESSSQYTVEVSQLEAPEDFYGKYFPFISAISDRYIVPKLRFQGGAYSADAGYSSDMTKIVTYSYRDPNVKETIDIIKGEADYLESMELTQEDLDGYILSTYGVVTGPEGSLEKHMTAMEYHMYGFDTAGFLKQAAQIKEASIEDKDQAAVALRKLLEKATYVTTGNQKQILEDKDSFEIVTDYRQAD